MHRAAEHVDLPVERGLYMRNGCLAIAVATSALLMTADAYGDDAGTRIELGSRPSVRSTAVRFGQVAGTLRSNDIVFTEVAPLQIEIGPRFANVIFLGLYASRSVVLQKSNQPFAITAYTRTGVELRGTWTAAPLELWAGAGVGVALMDVDHRISISSTARDAKVPGTEGTFEVGASWMLPNARSLSIGPSFGISAATFSSERINGQSFDAAMTQLSWIGGVRFTYAIATDEGGGRK
jgi:hypothetical protein